MVKKKRIEILNNIAGVITLGNTLKKLLEINGVKRKIFVCPSPIDDSFLEESNTKRKINQILYMGGGEPFKGIHVVIEAFNELNRKDINLLVAGKIRKAHKIDTKNYPENIKFLGYLNEKKLKKLYSESTFLVYPNLLFEAFSRCWAEAIICSCPVLIFKNRGGPADYYNGENAYAVNTNINDLKKGMEVMINNKKLRQRLSKTGLEYAKNNLLASVIVKKLNKIYDEVLNNSLNNISQKS